MPSNEEEEEEERDRHASELLSRLDDLGIEVPPNTSPRTLRAHKHQPRAFTKIAQQLACAIGPLIKMTGADNVNLALQSCVTLKNIRGASYEDCASRALGALAVLAVRDDFTLLRYAHFHSRVIGPPGIFCERRLARLICIRRALSFR